VHASPLVEFAPAKINLTLRITGRRADGYHELESLVTFAAPCDRLKLQPGEALSLSLSGPTAAAAGPTPDNLVLKAARALADQVSGLVTGRFELEKILPVAAGIGGGSSDAAAALRLLARANNLPLTDARLLASACRTGADVPVCLDPRPRVMRGIGEILSAALRLPPLSAVLINPGVAVPTREVFAALAAMRGGRFAAQDLVAGEIERAQEIASAAALITLLARSGNDLEEPAISLQPVIGRALAALRALPECKLARMSGSGATCFGLIERGAEDAARRLRERFPDWWITATVLGGDR
jgi:4-diphosphocytidyl-2-C-methyl-D-erythritol kinase